MGKTIDTCSLHAECMSRYVEQNQMFCSSHKQNAIFKPLWEIRQMPQRGAVDFGFRKPPPKPRESYFSDFLWAVAAVSVILGAVVFLMRRGIIPEPDKWRELRERGNVRQIGAPYRAPPVSGGGGAMQ